MVLSNSMHKEILCIISSDWDIYLSSPYVLVRKTWSFEKKTPKKQNRQGLKKVKLYLSPTWSWRLLFPIHWGLCSLWISETPDFLGLGPSVSSPRLPRSRPHCVRPLEGKRRCRSARASSLPRLGRDPASFCSTSTSHSDHRPARGEVAGDIPPRLPGAPGLGAGVVCPSLPLFFSSWEALLRALSWLLLLLSHFSRVRLCDPRDGSPAGVPWWKPLHSDEAAHDRVLVQDRPPSWPSSVFSLLGLLQGCF